MTGDMCMYNVIYILTHRHRHRHRHTHTHTHTQPFNGL